MIIRTKADLALALTLARAAGDSSQKEKALEALCYDLGIMERLAAWLPEGILEDLLVQGSKDWWAK